MIKVILDKEVIVVDTAAELASRLPDIFKADPRSDVMVTYVVTTQPTSRRMAPTT